MLFTVQKAPSPPPSATMLTALATLHRKTFFPFSFLFSSIPLFTSPFLSLWLTARSEWSAAAVAAVAALSSTLVLIAAFLTTQKQTETKRYRKKEQKHQSRRLPLHRCIISKYPCTVCLFQTLARINNWILLSCWFCFTFGWPILPNKHTFLTIL